MILCLLVGQSHVAITFFAGDFPPKPGRRFEFAARQAIGEFHFCDNETRMSAEININLYDNVLPRNFVTHFSQSSPRRTWPKRGKLLRAKPDLAFFAVTATSDLKRQRRPVVPSSKPNLSAC